MPEKKPFDLATLDTVAHADEGAEMTLRHPGTGRPLDITITIAGADSRLFRQALDEVSRRRVKESGRGGKASFAELEADKSDLLAKLTLGWSGMILDGEEVSCTYADARRVYERFPWIREQVDKFSADRANYLGN